MTSIHTCLLSPGNSRRTCWRAWTRRRAGSWTTTTSSTPSRSSRARPPKSDARSTRQTRSDLIKLYMTYGCKSCLSRFFLYCWICLSFIYSLVDKLEVVICLIPATNRVLGSKTFFEGESFYFLNDMARWYTRFVNITVILIIPTINKPSIMFEDMIQEKSGMSFILSLSRSDGKKG